MKTAASPHRLGSPPRRPDRRWLLPALLLLAFGLAAGEPDQPQATPGVVYLPFVAQGGSLWRPFSASSPWNTPIPANPALDPNSAAMIQQFSTPTSKYDPSFWLNVNRASPTLWMADDATPVYDVNCTLGNCPWFDAVPIPDNAVPDYEKDAHMAILNKTRTRVWEMGWAKKSAAGTWTAGWGTIYDLTGPGYNQPGYSSARGSGLPLIGGLIYLDEIKAGAINHALAISYYEPGPCFVWPASVNGYTPANPNAMPYGARVQLDPALNLDTLGLSPAAKVIARALQVYGAFIVDRFSSVISLPVESFYGKPGPNPWAGILDENDLIKLPANRFRVLKLGAQDCRVD